MTHPLGLALSAALLAALALLLAPAGARADEGGAVERPASQAPRGVDAFLAAIAGDDVQKLLPALPEKGRIELFGKKLDRERVESELKSKDPVTSLLHWPSAEGKPVAPAPLRMRIVSRGTGEVQVHPLGAAWPLCTLRTVHEAPFKLVECIEAPPAKK